MSDGVLRVLSVQSHVVSGYVGNKSATFPLQVLGFEVDTINSVQFSNHTGYGFWKGQIFNEADLDDLIEGLVKNKLDFYTHLLTGYISSPSFLERTMKLVKHLKNVNPELVYVCDPVMGDNGRLYVPKELVEVYKDLISLADIVTPNHFEAHVLTDEKIDTRESILSAINKIHAKGCKTVVISSAACGEQTLVIVGSTSSGDSQRVAEIKVPKIAESFTGTGDLFAALFLAWMQHSKNDLKEALEKTTATVQAVVQRTSEFSKKPIQVFPNNHGRLELKIIQSKADIESPPVIYRASVADYKK